MHTILKYTLDITQIQQVELPYDAEILTAMNLNGRICIWAKVNMETMRLDHVEPRNIYVIVTGNPMPEAEMRYISTVIMNMGTAFNITIFHVFEEIH